MVVVEDRGCGEGKEKNRIEEEERNLLVSEIYQSSSHFVIPEKLLGVSSTVYIDAWEGKRK